MKKTIRKKIPKGPYNSSRIGKCWYVCDKRGLVLRVLPNADAAEKWCRKHFAENPASVKVYQCNTIKSVRRVFDDQMKIGLTSAREIADLLWYGKVSTDWKDPKRKPGADRV